MKKWTYQLLLLCSLVGISIFFVGNVHAAESQANSIGHLPVQGSIGKIEDNPTTSPELGNGLLDIRVLIPKELAGTLPQTGAIIPNRFIKLLGIVLVVVGLTISLTMSEKMEKRNYFR